MYSSKNLLNQSSTSSTVVYTKKLILDGTDITSLISSGGGGGGSGNNYDNAVTIQIGQGAGGLNQGTQSVAIGMDAGFNQGNFSIALGSQAGQTQQGQNAIAIGRYAGRNNQHANSIVISASGANLNTAQSSSLYIDPIRVNNGTAGSVLTYDNTNKEIQYASNLTMSGSIAAATFFSSSDSRLKENIRPFPPVLDKIARIDPVMFEWKNDGKKDYGFIAQQFFKEMDFLKEAHRYEDVEFPKDSSGNDVFYSMEYAKITAILCKAIQELNEKIEALKKDVAI